MARDKDKGYTKRMVMFTCPGCGRTVEVPWSKMRKLCPDCAKERNRMESRARQRKDLDYIVQKNEALKKVKPSKPKLTDEEKAYRKQKKQCKGCHWWRSAGDAANQCCHYYLIHGVGHRRDPGSGPGDCHSFEPKQKRGRKEIYLEARRLLQQIEAENYALQPKKEDGADG